MDHPNAYTKRAKNHQKAQKAKAEDNRPTEFLYFAYGSNLNLAQMRLRCPTAEPVRKLVLRDWRLVFRGVADIEECPGSVVHGALYRIRAADEEALDIYEGVAHDLYRKVLFELTGTGEHAFMYLMNSKRVGVPTERYFRTIEEGFIDWDLPTASLNEALLRALPGDRATMKEMLRLNEGIAA